MQTLLWSIFVANKFFDDHPFVWVGIWIFVLANIFLAWMFLGIIKVAREPFGGSEFLRSRLKHIKRLLQLHRRRS